MFINNLKLINKAFDVLKEEEEKINYYYEPRFSKNDNKWKRHMNFNELKKDFIKDINDYGFCPFIENTCEEQMKNKNIMKFSKERFHDYTNHIKKINNIINDKKNLYKNYKSNSCGSIKIKDIKLNKIPKIKDKNILILSGLYNSMNETNFNNNNSKRNNSASILNLKNKNKKRITKIVKFSRDDIFDYRRIKKDKLLENELNKSISFESDEDYKNNDNCSLVEKNKTKIENNRIKILRNGIYNKQKKLNNKIKIKSVCNSQIIKNPIDKTLKCNQSIYKSSKKKKYSNYYLMKDTSISALFGKGKKEMDYLLNNNEYNIKHNMRYGKKIASIEKLENVSGGIFKIARKYDYFSKKNKKIKNLKKIYQ